MANELPAELENLGQNLGIVKGLSEQLQEPVEKNL